MVRIGPALRLAILVPIFLATPARAEPWRQGRFLIGGYGVNQAAREPGRLRLFAEAGLDYVHDSDHQIDLASEQLLVAQLDSLRRIDPGFDLQAILHYAYPLSDPGRFTKNPDAARNWPAIQRVVARGAGANRESTLGWSLWDEPCDRTSLAQAIDLVRRFRSNAETAGQLPMVNLLSVAYPGEASCLFQDFADPDRVNSWTKYAEAYLAAFDNDPWPAPVLSFDCYPYLIDGAVNSAYFETLKAARDLSLAHSRPGWRIPMWVIVQLAPFKPHGKPMMRGPSFLEARWQVWTALAYGARGITYWTVGSSNDSTLDEQFGRGIVDLHGQRTARHAPLKLLNREVHALGPTLMTLDPVAVLHAGRGRQGGVDDDLLTSSRRVYRIVSRVASAPGSADCLVGYFKQSGSGDDYLLVVNQGLEKARTFTLELDAPADSIERIDRATGQPVLVDRNSDRLVVSDLLPASGELFRVVNPLMEHLANVQGVGRSGSVSEYLCGERVLRVDYATGARKWTDRGVEPADLGARITPLGVLRKGH